MLIYDDIWRYHLIYIDIPIIADPLPNWHIHSYSVCLGPLSQRSPISEGILYRRKPSFLTINRPSTGHQPARSGPVASAELLRLRPTSVEAPDQSIKNIHMKNIRKHQSIWFIFFLSTFHTQQIGDLRLQALFSLLPKYAQMKSSGEKRKTIGLHVACEDNIYIVPEGDGPWMMPPSFYWNFTVFSPKTISRFGQSNYIQHMHAYVYAYMVLFHLFHIFPIKIPISSTIISNSSSTDLHLVLSTGASLASFVLFLSFELLSIGLRCDPSKIDSTDVVSLAHHSKRGGKLKHCLKKATSQWVSELPFL